MFKPTVNATLIAAVVLVSAMSTDIALDSGLAISEAQAVIGRPATPVSYAGVATGCVQAGDGRPAEALPCVGLDPDPASWADSALRVASLTSLAKCPGVGSLDRLGSLTFRLAAP
jgi:hypothetical protein